MFDAYPVDVVVIDDAQGQSQEEEVRHMFLRLQFADTRFTFDHIVAQTVLIVLERGPTSVRDRDLNRMYEQHQNFDKTGPIARKIKRTYDFLLRAFPDKTPELERYNVITLYCLASVLL